MNIPFTNTVGPRPRMLVCYLRGREYGTKSLPIHIPQCQNKWLEVEMQKPPNQRRPMPEPPQLRPSAHDQAIIKLGGSIAIDDMNEAAYATFEASLQKCPYCDRRFNDRAFLSHQKSCTRVRLAKPAGTGLIANSLSNRIVPGKVAGSRHAYAEVWVLTRAKPQGGWWGLRSKSAPKSRPKPVPQTESNLKVVIQDARTNKKERKDERVSFPGGDLEIAVIRTPLPRTSIPRSMSQCSMGTSPEGSISKQRNGCPGPSTLNSKNAKCFPLCRS